jgi:predicted nucleic acid-binding protein
MPERFTLDTNILIYSVDASNRSKHIRAVELMARAVGADCVLLRQSLAEFYHAATRKKLIDRAEAVAVVEDWMGAFPTAGYSEKAFRAALESASKHGRRLWDSLLIEAAKEANCGFLLSEDFQDGGRHGDLKIRNPFAGRELPDDLVRSLGFD